ncbi:uncharacterized protein LOC119687065 [Teleopsis dalmanni]|uniref:uncharacterized protein LOC119687065 n=1 Tax=Teleopsis dalmanni TaxID=139649 RepID=UPI0018CCCF4E|nr:uncharacterized protein LOC119687065 [Teleopsis dalmanni]
MGIAGKRILKALIQLKNPASAEDVVKHLAKTSKKGYELLRTDVMETITIAKKLRFIDFKNGLYSYTIATKKTRKKHAKKDNKNSCGFNTEKRPQFPSKEWIQFDDTEPRERVAKNSEDVGYKLTSKQPYLCYIEEFNDVNQPQALDEVKKLKSNFSVKKLKLSHEFKGEKQIYNPFVTFGKRLKRCASSDGEEYVPNKKRKLTSKQDSDRILVPQRKLGKYMPSDDLSKNRRGSAKSNHQISTGQAEKRNRTSDYGSATRLWSHPHLLSREEKQPAALNESYIQYKIHNIIDDLAKLKNNSNSSTGIQRLGNSNVGVSFHSRTRQRDLENFVEQPNHFFTTYGNKSEMGEDIVKKKIVEVIRQFDLLNSYSGVTALDIDSVKTIIHQIIDDYTNESESCGESSEKKSTDTDSVNNYMDEGPGSSRWDYSK